MTPRETKATLRAWMLVALLLLVALATRARAAGDDAGTAAASFLTTGPGGAATGMGGATLAFGTDLASAVWNPGALGACGSLQVAFAHAELADQTRQEWAAVGGTVRGPLWHWSLAGLFLDQGTFEGRDAAGQPTASFTAGSAALSGTIARSFGAAGAAGVTTRWVREALGPVSGSGIGFDLGIQLRKGMVGLGAAAQNLGGTMRYQGSSYPMPTSWGVGVALRHPAGIGVAVDYDLPRAYYQDVRAGIEYRWHEMVALRGGYRRELGSDPAGEALTGPSFGMGAGSRGWWLDYAYQPSSLGSTEHRIAVSFAPARARETGALGSREPADPPVTKGGR